METLQEINWTDWEPKERATLLFVIQGDKTLLIHKKRGLGAGNINAPGGRIEPGETPQQGAVREVEEELCITPHNVSLCGELSFQFTDEFSIHCTVYKADRYSGTPTETDEAKPHWCELDKIPYDSMWEDDRYWIPHMLNNTLFKGYFLFEKERMLEHRLELE
jgi:8-oxo-dGTP diphosphatase